MQSQPQWPEVTVNYLPIDEIGLLGSAQGVQVGEPEGGDVRVEVLLEHEIPFPLPAVVHTEV